MSDDTAVPLAVFAATLRPRVTATRTISSRRGAPLPVPVVEPGDPNEIWLRWLQTTHGAEKHTLAEWKKLIDDYAGQPAHPADPNY